MKVVFYYYNVQEALNWQNIWKSLRYFGVDARFVVEAPGKNTSNSITRNGYERIVQYLTECDYPFEKRRRHLDADAVVTTQTADWLKDYRGLKVNTLYGSTLTKDCWGYSREKLQGFDLILVHGEYSRQRIAANGIPENKIAIMGFPKYVDFFQNNINIDRWKSRFALDTRKKTIAYLPSWHLNSSIDHFADAVEKLASRYNVLIKPHHNNIEMENERIEKLKAIPGVCVELKSLSPAPFYVVSDLVLIDTRSGALAEGILTNSRIVGLHRRNNPNADLVEPVVYKVAPICESADRLFDLSNRLIGSERDDYRSVREFLKPYLFTDFNGCDDEIAAHKIIEYIERKRKKIFGLKNGVRSKKKNVNSIDKTPGNKKKATDSAVKDRNIVAIADDQSNRQDPCSDQGLTELNCIIPPEIKNDRFYDTICKISEKEDIKTVLEIGSSAGTGSTEAFVNGLKRNPHKPALFCMEISKPRFTELQKRYRNDAFVKCYNVSSVAIDKFPTEEEITKFYQSTKTALNAYPLDQVLQWYRQDIQYLKLSETSVDGIQMIKRENNIQEFDMVLIDGSEFTGQSELDQVYGAKIILLDDINAFKNYSNYKRLCQDPNYSLIEEDHDLRNGYAVFKHKGKILPIHFFTIVLNGKPFIEYHIEIFKQLPMRWHWHIVEGVADLKRDTAWSLQFGGQICDEMHCNGLSTDGTTEYIDTIAEQYPDQVTIYRKQNGSFWDGKLEMVNAPLQNIRESCMLWQVDSDELWTRDQILKLHAMFKQNPHKTAAFFHCHFFVGPGLVTITPEAYSHHDAYEWLRVWRFQPGMRWASHEPPQLTELNNGALRDVARVNPFSHEETSESHLVFTHYAYALESQVKFKEVYYGYSNAATQWRRLQRNESFPVNLRDYFYWVNDNCQADHVENRFFGRQVEPVALDFNRSIAIRRTKETNRRPIVIDGVIFQLQAGRLLGISRVWQNLIPEIKKTYPDRPIIVLRRGRHSLQIRGLNEYEVPLYHFGTDDVLDADDSMLSEICREQNAAVFISTYYTRAPGFSNILLLHDFIPEVLGFDLSQPEWRAKSRAIDNADAYLSVSEFTKKDFLRIYSNISPDKVTVAPNGVSKEFFPATRMEIDEFRLKYNLQSPYLILVGNRHGYKNCEAVLTAVSDMNADRLLQIAAIGGESVLNRQETVMAENLNLQIIPWLSDSELRTAYSGALALFYISRYEGFGLPIIEALACGCPVITTRMAAIPEVAGRAAIYVAPDDQAEIVTAISTVMKPSVRKKLAEYGMVHVESFNWNNTAGIVSSVIKDVIENDLLPGTLPKHDQGRLSRNTFENDRQISAVMYEDAQKLFVQGNPNAATESLIKLLHRFPAFSLAHNDLGVLYYNSGKKNKALQSYRKAVELEPENIIFLKNLADFYYVEMGQVEGAMQLYVKVLNANPEDLETLHVLAHICVSLEKFDDAKAFYNRILKIAPENKDARKFLEKPENRQLSVAGGQTDQENDETQSKEYLVSAIVSTYNSERFMRGCLEDLESQSIADKLEIVVINSGSQQNEEAVIREFQEKFTNIKYIKTDQRETVYAAWNRGIQAGTGKYITNANTDDRHRKDALEVMVNILETLPEISLVYADVIITETENEKFEMCTPVGYYNWMYFSRESLLNKGCFVGPQPMWRKQVHDEYGYFDDSLVTSGDYEFWLRISQTGTFLHLPVLLGLYLKSPGSIEHTNRSRQAEENRRILKMYSTAKSSGKIVRRLKNPKGSPVANNPMVAAAESSYRDAQELIQAKKYDTAIEKLVELTTQFPSFAVAHNDLAALYHGQDELQAALASYQKAVAIEPTNITFQKNLADFYCVALGKIEAAMDIYVDVLRQDSSDSEALLAMGHICRMLDRLKDADSFYARVLEIDSDNEIARNYLGNRKQDRMNTERLQTDESICRSLIQTMDNDPIEQLKNTKFNDAQLPSPDLQETNDEKHEKTAEPMSGPEPIAGSASQQRVSILIPASGPMKQLRRCVQAIERQTPEAHEIVFIDNGITRGCAKWLRTFLSKNNHCHKVRCEPGSNMAAVFNTGIAASQGELIVRISNDVEVTTNWLSTMVGHLKHAADAGVVGVMSNIAESCQKVSVSWNKTNAKLNDFAGGYRRRNHHRRIPADMVDGFCMLIRRNLIEKVGPFDEQVGQGGYEVEDLCLRAALGGYQNLIAGDVYLHRQIGKVSPRSKKTFDLKWSGADGNSPEGKRHLALLTVRKARRAWQAERVEEAGERFLQAIGLLPEWGNSYYQLARMLIQTSQFQEALEVLAQLPEGQPNAEALVLAASCEAGLMRYEKAQQLSDHALEIAPDAPPVLNAQGLLAYHKGDRQTAAEWFERATEADPGFAEAFTNLGALKWETGEKQTAVELYERGFVIDPSDHDIATAYHGAVCELAFYERARPIIRDAADAYPHCKKIRYMRIDGLLHLQAYPEAMEEIEGAMADFGVDDGILASALKIRKILGPLSPEKTQAANPAVSLCMIIKNEEEYLPGCLKSVKPVIDEMIVIDTGSDDDSPDIARAFGAKVYTCSWNGDFSEARNRSLSKASGDVVFLMDADEVISPMDYGLFRRLARQSSRKNRAFIINTRNYTLDNNIVHWVANEGHYGSVEAGTGWTSSPKIRMFPRNDRIHFSFPVHEMVEPSLEKLGIEMKPCDIQIHHFGKLNREKSKKKGEIYYEIGLRKLEETGDSPVALKELAIQAEVLKKHEEAIDLWMRYIDLSPGDPKAYINMGISYCNLGRYDKVLITAIKVLKLAPDSKEGHYNCALAKLHLGLPEQAIETLEKLFQNIPEYLPARFLLAAAQCIIGDKPAGMAMLEDLSRTTIGPGLAIRCHELAKGFMANHRPDYALALLDAAIETKNSNQAILKLYTDCLEMNDISKKTGTYE